MRTCGRNDDTGKLSFGHHHSHNCFRQDSSIKAKISGQNYDGKQGSYTISIGKVKIVTLQWKNLADVTSTKGSKGTSALMGQTGIMCLLT
jgi:hypothetical protein